MKKSRICLKIFFFLTVLLLIGQSSYSQCKLDRKKDDFGTGQTVNSKNVMLAIEVPHSFNDTWSLNMKYTLVDSLIYISITHDSKLLVSIVRSIFFKFKDGTIIKKETPNTTDDFIDRAGNQFKSTGFLITKSELESFATKDLEKFKVIFRAFPIKPEFENEITSRYSVKLKNDAACILNELQLITASKK